MKHSKNSPSSNPTPIADKGSKPAPTNRTTAAPPTHLNNGTAEGLTAVQRQMAQLGQLHGNQYVQHMVNSIQGKETTTGPFSGNPELSAILQGHGALREGDKGQASYIPS